MLIPCSAPCPSGGMVDAADSKSVACKGVLVRVRPGAPLQSGSVGHSGEASVQLSYRLQKQTVYFALLHWGSHLTVLSATRLLTGVAILTGLAGHASSASRYGSIRREP